MKATSWLGADHCKCYAILSLKGTFENHPSYPSAVVQNHLCKNLFPSFTKVHLGFGNPGKPFFQTVNLKRQHPHIQLYGVYV